MKVKNIAFSGFMAAILMGVSGAHAAINVASQAYVDGKLKNKADVAAVTTLEGNVSTLSQTVADNKSATDAAIQANADAIALKADQSALTELAGNVYTKEAADALLAGKVDNATLDNYYTKTETYTDDKIEQRITETLTSLEGGNINLGGYAKTDYVDTELAKKADKTQVATDIASAITSANGYTDAEIAKLSAEGGAVANAAAAAAAAQSAADAAQGAADAAQGAADAAQAKADSAYTLADAAMTSEEVDAKITALNLDTTYEKVGVAAGLDATLKTELQGEIQTAQQAAEAKVTELANGQVATNTSAIATNAAAIAQKQDTLNANQLSATNSGITAEKVSSYDTAVSELANKISMPEACKQENGNCVLGIMGGQVQWINLTEPVEEPVQA